MKLSEIQLLNEEAKWKYDFTADSASNALFGHSSKLKPGSRPTNIIRDYLKDKGPVTSVIGLNQHMVWPLKDGKYKVLLQTILYYREGTEETVAFMMSGEYDEKSKQFSKMKAQYTIGTFDRKLKTVKFPSGAMKAKALAMAIGKVIIPVIQKRVDDYAKGFKDYINKGGRGMMPGSVTRAK